jgi:hypothetical protein
LFKLHIKQRQNKIWYYLFGGIVKVFCNRPTLLHPLSQDILSQETAETVLFSRENFYFSQKIHYKNGNLKYLNNFHAFLGLQKAKFDSIIIPLFKIYVTKLLRNHHHAVACLFALILLTE